MAGTTVKSALFTFAGGIKKQGSIVGVCVKVLCFLVLGIKKGCFGAALVVFWLFFGGYGLFRVLSRALVTISVESSMCS